MKEVKPEIIVKAAVEILALRSRQGIEKPTVTLGEVFTKLRAKGHHPDLLGLRAALVNHFPRERRQGDYVYKLPEVQVTAPQG